MTTTPIARLDDVSGVKVPQPYTVADLELGRKLVRQLHGVGSGFDAWAEHLAKAIVAERTASSKRIRVLTKALQKIADWELPSTGETWPGSGHPITYETQYGFTGTQDFIRGVARAALHAEPDRSGG